MRLAWFTPWPPQSSGVAGRSAELVPQLAARGHAVDVFVDEQQVAVAPADTAPPRPGAVRVQSAHDFVWRQARGQYDLAVYQIGNSRVHQYLWPYLVRWPGLAVLHDTKLHHARGDALLSRGRLDDYRTEFAWNHPDTSANAAELGVAGFSGAYYYQWPMLRTVVDSSRLVATHARGAVPGLREAWPGRAIDYIALGEGLADPPTEDQRRARRHALGVPDDAVLFGTFGALTPDKRVPQILEAFATTRHRLPEARLLLAGTPDPTLDLPWIIRMAGLADVASVIETPDDEDFDRLIGATDVTLSLRWPSAGEMSGPWLRALATGRATVVLDLEQLGDVPTLDPRTWRPSGPGGSGTGEAVAAAVDIMDEGHSLRLALVRLGTDSVLRADLGRAARAWWEAEHTVDRMADDYEAAFARAVASAPPKAALPEHLRPDPLGAARDLVTAIDDDLMGRLEPLCASS